jgi:hypothetical protein
MTNKIPHVDFPSALVLPHPLTPEQVQRRTNSCRQFLTSSKLAPFVLPHFCNHDGRPTIAALYAAGFWTFPWRKYQPLPYSCRVRRRLLQSHRTANCRPVRSLTETTADYQKTLQRPGLNFGTSGPWSCWHIPLVWKTWYLVVLVMNAPVPLLNRFQHPRSYQDHRGNHCY